MIVKHKENPGVPVYNPITLEIVLETENEAIGFAHLLGCSVQVSTCSCPGQVKEVQSKLSTKLLGYLPIRSER